MGTKWCAALVRAFDTFPKIIKVPTEMWRGLPSIASVSSMARVVRTMSSVPQTATQKLFSTELGHFIMIVSEPVESQIQHPPSRSSASRDIL